MNVGISESMHIPGNMYKFRFCNFEVWPSPFFFFGGGGSPFLTSISSRG